MLFIWKKKISPFYENRLPSKHPCGDVQLSHATEYNNTYEQLFSLGSQNAIGRNDISDNRLPGTQGREHLDLKQWIRTGYPFLLGYNLPINI